MKHEKFDQGVYMSNHSELESFKGVCCALSLVWLECNIKKRTFNKYIERQKIVSRVQYYQRRHHDDRNFLRANRINTITDTDSGYYRTWSSERQCEFLYYVEKNKGEGSISAFMVDLTREIFSPGFGQEVYGSFHVSGDEYGHAMAWIFKNKKYSFFDCNYGLWSEVSPSEIIPLIDTHIKTYYPELNKQWTVAKFSSSRRRGVFSCFGGR